MFSIDNATCFTWNNMTLEDDYDDDVDKAYSYIRNIL